jgi:hypothetical protein
VLEQRGFLFADDTLMNKDTRNAYARARVARRAMPNCNKVRRYNLVDVDQLIRRKRRSRLQVQRRHRARACDV